MLLRCVMGLVLAAIVGGHAIPVDGGGSGPDDPFTFVVGYGEGSVFDTYTRLLARHLSRHLPDPATIRVENRVGGGGMVAAMHMYEQAKPDGRTIGNWSGDLVLKQIFGSEQVSFDVRRFNWVGAISTEHPVCVLTKASGINGLEDWSKARRPMRLGGIGQNGTTPTMASVLAEALELPVKLIGGYRGTVKVRLAAEARELDGGCWHWQSVKRGWAAMLKSGDARVVLQAMVQAHPDLSAVPNAIELAGSPEARQLIRHGIHDPATIARFYSLPPGTPKQKVARVRQLFDKTLQDPRFLAEAERLGLDINPVDGTRIEETVTGLFALEPTLKVRLRKVLFPDPDSDGPGTKQQAQSNEQPGSAPWR